MDIELQEIRDFIAAQPPFSALNSEALAGLPRRVTIRYLRRGAPFPPQEGTDTPPQFYLVRSGAIELRDAQGLLLDKLGEGDHYASPCRRDEVVSGGRAVEDTLLYLLPCDHIQALAGGNLEFASAISRSVEGRLRRALQGLQRQGSDTLTHLEVADLASHPVISATPTTPIAEAAQQMSRAQVSALLLVEDERCVGIVTDRDLRERCLAAGLPPEQPVSTIMTAAPRTIEHSRGAYEALLTMTRHNIHHLPVLREGRLWGVVSDSDLLRQQGLRHNYLGRDIAAADSQQALREIAASLPDVQRRLIREGLSARQVGRTITALYDAFARRLIELTVEELGPAPLPWVWLVVGSQARREQNVHTDQDNALLIADGYDEAAHGPWFTALAERVSDGLNAIGQVYCPGEVMARNPRWRQPLSVWQGYFRDWIERPDPEALMLASNFFDMRPLAGERSLFEALFADLHQRAASNTIFLAHMAGNALTHRPPLGFFRHLVLVHDGEHDHTLDLKQRGVVPIMELARLYALEQGLAATNSWERLEAVAGSPSLSDSGAGELLDALDFIATTRLRHQVRQIDAGLSPDNFLDPRELSALERSHLKDAFAVVATLQASLAQRYQGGAPT